jgi:hypothetical protein
MPTRSLGFQSFYQAQLTSAISDTDLTIPLDVLPTSSEGILVIESTVAAKREIIYYTSKTASAVVCPSGAGNGRGYDGTTAVSHLQNSAVIMAPVAQMFKSLQDGTSMSSTVALQNLTVSGTLSVGGQTPTADWSQLASAPNTVTANGNRSYSLVFNGVDYTGTIQPGTRVRTTRTVAAPTQSTSLNGTTQYYSKTSPAGMTFTDDFVVSAWIKLNSYPTVAAQIASRYDGTSGWSFDIDNSGRLRLLGYNAGSSNVSYIMSYQSVPLNKWIHVAAQLDMSTFTATTTTSYTMIDGVDVPASVSRGGTNPTSLLQAGNLEVGSRNSGTQFFPGKIAQVAIYNAKVTQATILASIDRTLTGSETSLISAYSFNNVITDLNTTNANNLTANGSAVATNADSPFGGQANGTISSTLDYGIVQSVSFSTNTTAVVQVSEGNTIPTTGGVAALYYSSAKAPYGFPASRDKWSLIMFTNNVTVNGTTGITSNQNPGGLKLVVPIGSWSYSGLVGLTLGFGSAGNTSSYGDIGTTISALNVNTFSYFYIEGQANSNVTHKVQSNELTVSVATNLYIIAATGRATSTTFYISNASILAVPGNL